MGEPACILQTGLPYNIGHFCESFKLGFITFYIESVN